MELTVEFWRTNPHTTVSPLDHFPMKKLSQNPSSITVWLGSSARQDRMRLQQAIRFAEMIIRVDLSTNQDLDRSRVRKRAAKILTEPTQPAHKLFKHLPSGQSYIGLFAKISWKKGILESNFKDNLSKFTQEWRVF